MFSNSFKCVRVNDWIIILLTLLFFMSVQTMFFYYIGSKQYENVLNDKVQIIKLISDKNPELKEVIKQYKKVYKQQNEVLIRNQREKREKINDDLTIKYCIRPIVAVIIVILLIIMLNYSRVKSEWTRSDTLALILILAGYITEILFFFFIVKKYEFVGDHYIIYILTK